MPGELSVFGTYSPGPWKTNAAIVAAAAKFEWNPSTAELKAFAESGKTKSEGVVNAFNFLCAIIRHKPDRINIFTHANDRFLYFSGKVVPGDVWWDTTRPENALDVDYLDGQEKNGLGFSDRLTREGTYKRFRQALPRHSKICIYACHAALGGELCRGIADYFRVKVLGFSDEVRYYPTLSKKGGLNMKYSIGTNPQVSNFHDLDRYFLAPFTSP
jgi:hypothetical protein